MESESYASKMIKRFREAKPAPASERRARGDSANMWWRGNSGSADQTSELEIIDPELQPRPAPIMTSRDSFPSRPMSTSWDRRSDEVLPQRNAMNRSKDLTSSFDYNDFIEREIREIENEFIGTKNTAPNRRSGDESAKYRMDNSNIRNRGSYGNYDDISEIRYRDRMRDSIQLSSSFDRPFLGGMGGGGGNTLGGSGLLDPNLRLDGDYLLELAKAREKKEEEKKADQLNGGNFVDVTSNLEELLKTLQADKVRLGVEDEDADRELPDSIAQVTQTLETAMMDSMTYFESRRLEQEEEEANRKIRDDAMKEEGRREERSKLSEMVNRVIGEKSDRIVDSARQVNHNMDPMSSVLSRGGQVNFSRRGLSSIGTIQSRINNELNDVETLFKEIKRTNHALKRASAPPPSTMLSLPIERPLCDVAKDIASTLDETMSSLLSRFESNEEQQSIEPISTEAQPTSPLPMLISVAESAVSNVMSTAIASTIGANTAISNHLHSQPQSQPQQASVITSAVNVAPDDSARKSSANSISYENANIINNNKSSTTNNHNNNDITSHKGNENHSFPNTGTSTVSSSTAPTQHVAAAKVATVQQTPRTPSNTTSHNSSDTLHTKDVHEDDRDLGHGSSHISNNSNNTNIVLPSYDVLGNDSRVRVPDKVSFQCAVEQPSFLRDSRPTIGNASLYMRDLTTDTRNLTYYQSASQESKMSSPIKNPPFNFTPPSVDSSFHDREEFLRKMQAIRNSVTKKR